MGVSAHGWHIQWQQPIAFHIAPCGQGDDGGLEQAASIFGFEVLVGAQACVGGQDDDILAQGPPAV